MTIFFSRNDRAIIINYGHTCLHKTVAQLKDHFKRPPKVLGPGAPKPKQAKTQKGDGAGNAEESTQAGEDGTTTEATPKKRREKKAQDENGNPRRRKKNKDEAAGAAPAASEGASQTPSVPLSFGVNVTPAEAKRRQEAANALLSGAGVDPSTLSPEQFSIFSNQSPELQKESLAMLAKYGAERLRIVHPSGQKAAASNASASTTAAAAATQPSASGPTTTRELVPEEQGTNKKKKGGSKKRKAPNDEEAVVASSTEPQSDVANGVKKRKLGKSRTACSQCKNRKTKVRTH